MATVDPDFLMEPATYSDPDIAGGGFAHVNLTHPVAFIQWLLGLKPVRVQAQMFAPEHPLMDLHAAISVTYEGGCLVSFTGGVSPAAKERHQFRLHAYGAEGQLVADLEGDMLEVFRSDTGLVRYPVEAGEGIYECSEPVRRLLSAARGRSIDNRSGPELSADVVGILEAAYQSHTRGGRVSVPSWRELGSQPDAQERGQD